MIAGLIAFATSAAGRWVLGALMMLGVWVAGSWHGSGVAQRACEARIQQSIVEAASFDAERARVQNELHRSQMAEATKRETEQQARIDEYARTHRSCSLGEHADWLNSLRTPGSIQPSAPQPPPRQ